MEELNIKIDGIENELTKEVGFEVFINDFILPREIAKFFFFTGNQNSQFYVDDIDQPDFYDYGTKTTILSVGGQRKVFGQFYAGLSYTYAHYNTVYEDDISPSSISV